MVRTTPLRDAVTIVPRFFSFATTTPRHWAAPAVAGSAAATATTTAISKARFIEVPFLRYDCPNRTDLRPHPARGVSAEKLAHLDRIHPDGGRQAPGIA